MVRSEDEIRRYDVFKGSVLGLIALFTLFGFRQEAKAAKAELNRIGFALSEPFDTLIESDPATFAGSAPPGYKVYLISQKETLGSAVADDRTNWRFEVPAAKLDGVAVTLMCKDGNTLFETKEPVDYQLSDEVRKKIKEDRKNPARSPVDVKKPTNGEALRSGINAIFGTASPAAKVKVYANRELLATVEADQNGDWKMATEFRPGEYRLSAVTPADQSTVEFKVR